MSFIEQISGYGAWRDEVNKAVGKLRTWLLRNEVSDAQSDLRLQHVGARLREDQLTIAFVAEFSRGKSELINAIFFSDYGDRVLPSSSGRTTMCPTELQWAPRSEAAIRLLPIRTRARNASISELKNLPSEWVSEPLDSASLPALQRALARVSETEWVTQEECQELGFPIDESGQRGLKPQADGMVEIPAWRHALIGFDHPLLEQGLVVLDTPGLNAIGAEPELTVSLLPNSHAVLFILAADTGVTQSDMTIWRDYVATGASSKGRLVVLNKIDGLWDGLRDEARIAEELDRQVTSASAMLDVPATRVFPLSAQKGLVGRIQGGQALVERSRLPEFERALSEDLLPTKREIVTEHTLGEVREIVVQVRELLNARLASLNEQVGEMTDLRGKNQSVIEYMMRKIRAEKNEFEEGLQKYYAVRTVFSTLTNKLLGHLGMDAVRKETLRTRDAMLDSSFSRGLSEAMENYFKGLRGNLARSNAEISEINTMLHTMYRRFSVEHGLTLTPPEAFSTRRYERDLDRLERVFNTQLNTTLRLMTTGKQALTERFFDSIAVEARRTFELANRDVEQWLRTVMAPLETQVREYQLQLKRRLESIKRIHEATGTLEGRVEELNQANELLRVQLDELDAAEFDIYRALGVAIHADSRTGHVA